MVRTTTKPIAGTTFYVLLALADRERYGLGIAQEVERRTGGSVRLGPGTLYNTIKKLLAGGWIEEAPDGDAAAGGDPRRRYYRITEAGLRLVETEAERLELLVNAARDKQLLSTRPDA
jgi:DNA-binding PadR family transcriptional regulator